MNKLASMVVHPLKAFMLACAGVGQREINQLLDRIRYELDAIEKNIESKKMSYPVSPSSLI
ncbi:MAG: hypothetical protein E6017_17225, partial [Kluyvera cryocrescens]|nr:hypothetical protein [Kluyvera cryocrescens]